MRDTRASSQFAAGFVSSLVLLAGVALVARAVVWVTTNPQPQAFIEFLNKPLLSIFDIVGILFWLSVIGVLVSVARWGPRL